MKPLKRITPAELDRLARFVRDDKPGQEHKTLHGLYRRYRKWYTVAGHVMSHEWRPDLSRDDAQPIVEAFEQAGRLWELAATIHPYINLPPAPRVHSRIDIGAVAALLAQPDSICRAAMACLEDE